MTIGTVVLRVQADLLGVARHNTERLQHRCPDMPRPVTDVGQGHQALAPS